MIDSNAFLRGPDACRVEFYSTGGAQTQSRMPKLNWVTVRWNLGPTEKQGIFWHQAGCPVWPAFPKRQSKNALTWFSPSDRLNGSATLQKKNRNRQTDSYRWTACKQLNNLQQRKRSDGPQSRRTLLDLSRNDWFQCFSARTQMRIFQFLFCLSGKTNVVQECSQYAEFCLN